MALNLVPQVGQNLGNTQQPILDNFTNINVNFAVDHVAFNSGADSGKHAKITFPITVALPVYANPNETGLYGFLNGTSNKQEINVFKSLAFGFANTDRVPITLQRGNLAGATANNYTVAIPFNPGPTVDPETYNYFYLPCGLFVQIMQCKFQSSISFFDFQYPQAFTNRVLNVQVSPLNDTSTIYNVNIGRDVPNPLTHVRLRRNVTSGTTFMVLAIGI